MNTINTPFIVKFSTFTVLDTEKIIPFFNKDETLLYLKHNTCAIPELTNSKFENNEPIISYIGEEHKLTTPSDPILAKLCEKSGAKMYGDYLVLRQKAVRNDYVMDGDVLLYTKNSGLCFCYKDYEFILNTDMIYCKNDQMCINDKINHSNGEYDFRLNCPNLEEEIEKIKQNPNFILDPRQSVYMSKKGEDKLKKDIEQKSKTFFEMKYFERIAPSGYNKYCNIFEEYSKFLRNEESKFQELKKVLDL
jgi:hypothetical protein